MCSMFVSESTLLIHRESNYRGGLRELREGSSVVRVDFAGARFDPFGEDEREALEQLDGILRGCKYILMEGI